MIRAGLIVLILLGGSATLYSSRGRLSPPRRRSSRRRRCAAATSAASSCSLLVVLSLVGGSGVIDGSGWGIWWFCGSPSPSASSCGITRNREPGQAVVPSGQSAPYAAPYAGRMAPCPSGPRHWAPPACRLPGQRPPHWSPLAAPRPPWPPARRPPASCPRAWPPALGSGWTSVPPCGALPAAAQPPRPPAPPRPRHRSAGFLAAVIVAGVALAAYGLDRLGPRSSAGPVTSTSPAWLSPWAWSPSASWACIAASARA